MDYDYDVCMTLTLRVSSEQSKQDLFDLFSKALSKFISSNKLQRAFENKLLFCRIVYDFDHPDGLVVNPHVHIFYSFSESFVRKIPLRHAELSKIWRDCASLDYDPFVYLMVINEQ